MSKLQKAILWILLAIVILADAFFGPGRLEPLIYAALVLFIAFGAFRSVRAE